MEVRFKDKKSKTILVVTQSTLIEKMKKEKDNYELIEDKNNKDKNNKDKEESQETSRK